MPWILIHDELLLRIHHVLTAPVADLEDVLRGHVLGGHVAHRALVSLDLGALEGAEIDQRIGPLEGE
ncbi:MAG: hypothetical protein QM820_20410 [Minicystis sp.]